MKTSLSNVLLGVAQCILLLTCGVQSAAAQSLVNGSFELPALPGGYQYSPAAAGIGWAFSGSSGIQGNGSAWTAAPAPDGTQTAFIQGTGSMSQALLLSASGIPSGLMASDFALASAPIESRP